MRISQFLLLLTFVGCSFFIEKIDTPLVDKKNYLKNIPEVPTYCPVDEKLALQLIGSSGNSQDVYLSMVQKLGRKLDIFDHFALWSLTQLSLRPDQSAPTSRLQLVIQNKGESYYFDFFSESPDNMYPFLYGVEWVLRRFKKQERLETYAKILNETLSGKLIIGKELESFLTKHTDAIKANTELLPFYFRGNEVLRENESSPRIDYSAVLRHYREHQKNQKIVVNTSLIQFVTDKGLKGACNYDFNLYNNSIFLIDKVIPVANLYGVSVPGGAFMASTSQKLDQMVSFQGLPLFQGESRIRSTAVCVMEEGKNKIWTFSNQSRDPGQHLFHLVRYGISRSQNITDVDKLLRHSRHLFLSDPVRLIIESGRSRQDQVENLLKLNLPIYNSQKLGNIWAYTLFNDVDRFIIDDRNPGKFACRK